jgi:hypothetical protein
MRLAARSKDRYSNIAASFAKASSTISGGAASSLRARRAPRSSAWGWSQWRRNMLTPLVKPTLLFLAIALALSGCGVNYHFEPSARTWPAAAKAPNK